MATPSAAADPVSFPEPSAEAREVARKLVVTDLGVDRQGNLWTWNRPAEMLRMLTPSGRWLQTVSLPGVADVDADAEWGVAGIALDRRQLTVRRPSGTEQVFQLESTLGDVQWLSEDLLALSPQEGVDRVWLFDVRQGQIAARWGQEAWIEPTGPGFHRVRFVLLDLDAQRQRLWTLETFTGRWILYNLSGSEIARGQVVDPTLEATQAQLDQMDREMRAQGQRQLSTMHKWISLGLDPAGSGWLVEACRPEPKLIKLRPGQPVEEHSPGSLPCCSGSIQFWGRTMVIYRDTTYPRSETCMDFLEVDNELETSATP